MCAKNHLLIFSSFLDIWENVEWPRFFGPPCRRIKLTMRILDLGLRSIFVSADRQQVIRPICTSVLWWHHAAGEISDTYTLLRNLGVRSLDSFIVEFLFYHIHCSMFLMLVVFMCVYFYVLRLA